MLNVTKLTFNLTLTCTDIFANSRIIISKYQRMTVTNHIFKLLRNTLVPVKNIQIRQTSSCKQTKTMSALVLLAPGAEELEFISVVDVLRRGEIKVTIGGVCGKEPVKCRCDTVICPDKSIQDACKEGPYGVIVLPGGLGGSKLLSESEEVGKLLRHQEKSDGLIAAICAAPTALKAHGIGKGKRITSYPAMAEELSKGDIYKYEEKCPVVQDGKLITSRGPATALIFAFTILENLKGKEVAKQVAAGMLYEY